MSNLPSLTDLPSPSAVQLSICDKFFLGKGGNATVYSIDGDDRFVVHVGTFHLGWEGKTPQVSDEITIREDTRFNGRNFGQCVASYGEGISLLYRQKGLPCGRGRGGTTESQEEDDKIYEEQTRAAGCIPLSSYIALLKDVKFLHSIGMTFDPSKSNNLLIDSENQKFNFVDIGTIGANEAKSGPDHLIRMIFDSGFQAQAYKGSHEEQLIADRRIIFDKMLMATDVLKMPFSDCPLEANNGLKYYLAMADYKENTPERSAIEVRINATGIQSLAEWQANRPSLVTFTKKP